MSTICFIVAAHLTNRLLSCCIAWLLLVDDRIEGRLHKKAKNLLLSLLLVVRAINISVVSGVAITSFVSVVAISFVAVVAIITSFVAVAAILLVVSVLALSTNNFFALVFNVLVLNK